MRFGAVVAAVLLALLAGCGAPGALSRDEAAKLAGARERLDNALDTEATLTTSPRRTRRILAEVRRITSTGSFEAEKLDEFGLAALGELQQVVPSVVKTDADGVPEDLDRKALRAFLRYARTDPARALLGPARDEVAVIEKTLEDSGADGDTKVRRETLDEYVRAVERDVEPVWPELADRLGNVL